MLVKKFHRDEKGTVTAECAIALPAVTLVLWLALEIGAAMHQQLTLHDATTQITRILARHEPEAKASTLMNTLAPHAQWSQHKGEFTVVRSWQDYRFKIVPFHLRLHSSCKILTESTVE
ncbi:MAG: TadE family type IV pilus minor pilin [Micrococcaceae bacterium]